MIVQHPSIVDLLSLKVLTDMSCRSLEVSEAAGAKLRSEERRDSVRGSGFVRAVERGVKKNGSGELGLRFIAERASAPLKHSQEAAGLSRRNPSVRVTGEPTKREQTRLLGLALTGGCV